MPIKINGYQCDKCLYVHSTFELAQSCEKRHGHDFVYIPDFDKGSVGPSSIKCQFTKENGEKYEKHYY
jgi:hypothetical protein